jgi:tetratricopeptide (TPR) repeat protein
MVRRSFSPIRGGNQTGHFNFLERPGDTGAKSEQPPEGAFFCAFPFRPPGLEIDLPSSIKELSMEPAKAKLAPARSPAGRSDGPVPPPARTTGALVATTAVLALAALAAYGNSFRVPFLLDDQAAIVGNPSIRHLGRLAAVVWPPDNVPTGGRPLLNLSFALNYAWGGLAVGSYHGFNLIGHVLAAFALLGLVRQTLLRPGLRPRYGPAALPLSALIAGIWLLHPLQTEAVTYVCQRAESLMGLLYLLTLYFFARAASSPHPRRWLAASVLMAFAGMATKEGMVTAPLLVLLYDRAFVSASVRHALRHRRGYYVALATAWVFLGFLMVSSHLTAHRGVGFHAGVGSLAYARMETGAIVHYLRLALWPRPLVFDYGPDGWHLSLRQVLPRALLLLAGAAATVLAWRRLPAAGFLGVAFFLLLSPHSSFVPVAAQPVAESRMYLPLAAVVAAIVLALYAAGGRRSFLLLLAAAVGLGCATARRNQDYRSAVALWSDTVAKAPDSPRARTNLGIALAETPGRLAEAIAQYDEALRLQPRRAETHNNLANALIQVPGRQSEALAHYAEAIRLQPNYAEAHFNFAGALCRMPGRLPDAIDQFEAGLRVEPTSAEANNRLGVAYAQMGRSDEATRHFEIALRLNPELSAARANLLRLQPQKNGAD